MALAEDDHRRALLWELGRHRGARRGGLSEELLQRLTATLQGGGAQALRALQLVGVEQTSKDIQRIYTVVKVEMTKWGEMARAIRWRNSTLSSFCAMFRVVFD